jgi:hypothetical protein
MASAEMSATKRKSGGKPVTKSVTGRSLTIRAEIVGQNQANACGVTVSRHAPVLALCRALIGAGHDPATPLEAYRGSTPCLRVRSIGEGAKLTVSEATSDGKPRFAPFHAFPDMAANVSGRAPVRQTAREAA